MPKVIILKDYLKKLDKIKPYTTDVATEDLISFKRYKISSSISKLFVKFLTKKKTYREFLEALPKLEPELMYYVVSSYYLAWHKRYCQLVKTVHLFKNLKIAFKKYYSKENYKRIFYYICYPKLKFINDR
jgi:Glu-tRNA(Gln) amidotransferase subunit E-like FAD-binding protein